MKTDAEHKAFWMGIKHQSAQEIGRIAREPRPETQTEIIDYLEMIYKNGTARDYVAASLAAAAWEHACDELHYAS